MTISADERLYFATTRLVTAIERLEHNIQHVRVGQDREIQQNQHLLEYQRQNSALLAEKERLQEAISNMEQQYQELQSVASTIYGKLDSSIERLNHILEKP